MKVMDLFAGIGGMSLGLERAGMTTTAFCEIDPYCQQVLRKHWPDTPIYDDVRSMDYDGAVDLICGGYPCQPFSVAGQRKGEDDDRHLWPAMLRLIQRHRPAWVLGENVAGHISMGLDNVLSELEGEGYACQAFVIPACAVDAKHRRDRVWIVGHAEHDGSSAAEAGGAMHRPPQQERTQQERQSAGASGLPENVAKEHDATLRGKNATDTSSTRPQGRKLQKTHSREVGKRREGAHGPVAECRGNEHRRGWEPEPAVGRVANGIPRRMDRLRCLGNAVVPQVVEVIGRAIMQVEAINGEAVTRNSKAD